MAVFQECKQLTPASCLQRTVNKWGISKEYAGNSQNLNGNGKRGCKMAILDG